MSIKSKASSIISLALRVLSLKNQEKKKKSVFPTHKTLLGIYTILHLKNCTTRGGESFRILVRGWGPELVGVKDNKAIGQV